MKAMFVCGGASLSDAARSRFIILFYRRNSSEILTLFFFFLPPNFTRTNSAGVTMSPVDDPTKFKLRGAVERGAYSRRNHADPVATKYIEPFVSIETTWLRRVASSPLRSTPPIVLIFGVTNGGQHLSRRSEAKTEGTRPT